MKLKKYIILVLTLTMVFILTSCNNSNGISAETLNEIQMSLTNIEASLSDYAHSQLSGTTVSNSDKTENDVADNVVDESGTFSAGTDSEESVDNTVESSSTDSIGSQGNAINAGVITNATNGMQTNATATSASSTSPETTENTDSSIDSTTGITDTTPAPTPVPTAVPTATPDASDTDAIVEEHNWELIDGHYETVTVTGTIVDEEAWIEYIDYYVCNGCGYTSYNLNDISTHVESEGCTYTGYWETIAHDAVTHEGLITEEQWVDAMYVCTDCGLTRMLP